MRKLKSSCDPSKAPSNGAAAELPANFTTSFGNPPGYLYACAHPHRPGYLKLGETKKCPLGRMAQHAGYANVQFTPLFAIETPDSIQSEAIWFALLAELKHPDFRELFEIDVETARAACVKAIAATRCLPAPPPRPSSAPAVTATSKNEAVEHLLSCPMQFRGKSVRLAEVVGLAQKDAGALRKLSQLGLESKGWDAKRPEYALDLSVGGLLLKWMALSTHAFEDLGDFFKNELRVSFAVENH